MAPAPFDKSVVLIYAVLLPAISSSLHRHQHYTVTVTSLDKIARLVDKFQRKIGEFKQNFNSTRLSPPADLLGKTLALFNDIESLMDHGNKLHREWLERKIKLKEKKEENESETLEGGKSGKVNKVFEKSPSLDSRASEVQLEMSWLTTAIDGSSINSSPHTLQNIQVKRLHRKAPFITKFLLSFLLIIKLFLRQPLYTLAQLLLPALLVSLLSTFVGQNPFAEPEHRF